MLKRQGKRKGNCERCDVNLRPGYGFTVDGTLLCVICTENRIGKDTVRAFEASLLTLAKHTP